MTEGQVVVVVVDTFNASNQQADLCEFEASSRTARDTKRNPVSSKQTNKHIND